MDRFARCLFLPGLAMLFATCGAKLGGLDSAASPAARADPEGRVAKAGGVGVGRSPAEAAADRMLVYRGELAIEVARPDEAVRLLLAKVKELGGHLQKQVATTLIVRLPAAQFDAAFAAASAMGRVLRESREANDVTEEYVDLGIRLDTARKARDRLLEVLLKAEKIDDILRVENELRRLTEEIERMEGRRKLLADQVAMATLEVAFQAPAAAPPPERRVRQGNRFHWINQIGAEALMEQF